MLCGNYNVRVKMQKQPIYNLICVTCGGSVRPVVWKAEYGHRPQFPSILDWSESCSCCFLTKQVLHFLKSGKQMIAPVDCLLNAANWEWLNKSEVEMLFLWVEKCEYLKKRAKSGVKTSQELLSICRSHSLILSVTNPQCRDSSFSIVRNSELCHQVTIH